MRITRTSIRHLWGRCFPRLVDASYVVGVAGGVGHAVMRAEAFAAHRRQRFAAWPTAEAMCGESTQLNRAWAYGLPDLLPWEPCDACRWRVAAETGGIDAELARIAPTAADLVVMGAHMQDPFIVVRVCRALLAREEFDGDDQHMARVLGHVSAHRPMVIRPEECAEGECDHPDEDGEPTCPTSEATVVCATCSVRAGRYAGEWAGMFGGECTVLAPCDVLRTFVRTYEVELGGTAEAGR